MFHSFGRRAEPPCPNCWGAQCSMNCVPARGAKAGPSDGTNRCARCGCTDDSQCAGGCHWIAPALCSACCKEPA